MQSYRYFLSQSNEFCRHNHLCCFSRVISIVSVYFVSCSMVAGYQHFRGQCYPHHEDCSVLVKVEGGGRYVDGHTDLIVP